MNNYMFFTDTQMWNIYYHSRARQLKPSPPIYTELPVDVMSKITGHKLDLLQFFTAMNVSYSLLLFCLFIEHIFRIELVSY